MTISFSKIYNLAAQRKNGSENLELILPKKIPDNYIKGIPSDRFLSAMTQCVFQSGFVWKVIAKKWPEFEEAFYNFNLNTLIDLPPRIWEAYAQDKRIVRNPQKISTVFKNAMMILDIEAENNCTIAEFLVDWPKTNQIDLLALLKQRGDRLGGMTGQYFLRKMGIDCFILSRDVVAALQHAGLDIKPNPTSKKDLKTIQEQFNSWQKETGRSYSQISKILAYSIGENYDAQFIKEEISKHELQKN